MAKAVNVRVVVTFSPFDPTEYRRIGSPRAEPNQAVITLSGSLLRLCALRQKWAVDAEPATRAAADHIIATLTAAELAEGLGEDD